MRTHSARLRLPTALAVRPRLEARPFDVNGWLDQKDAAAPRSDHSPTAPPVENKEKLPEYADHNTGLILRSRKLRNEPDVTAMRKVASLTPGVFHLGHLLRRCRPDARGFTAAVNLIDDGFLVPIEHGRIRPELRVRCSA
ncbi:hypothetical protein LJR016_002286 [Devosia sp. LjRoot16]|uniref:hypothetical protein n=1 Tax=Devosia sp. LjRoot16 TaxID=3342271 RepID=UPI003ECC816E